MNKLPPSQLDKVLFGAIDLLNSGQQKFLSSLGNNSYELLVSYQLVHCVISSNFAFVVSLTIVIFFVLLRSNWPS